MKISLFFSDYLVGRKTCYSWNGFTSLSFSTDIGVGQGSALSPILSALFIALIFHIFEKRLKNLNIPVFFLSFVDDKLFISQEKSYIKTNANLFCCYVIAIRSVWTCNRTWKNKIFYFSRLYEIFNPPALNFS